MQHLQPWKSAALAQSHSQHQEAKKNPLKYHFEAYADFHVVTLYVDEAPLLLVGDPSAMPQLSPWELCAAGDLGSMESKPNLLSRAHDNALIVSQTSVHSTLLYPQAVLPVCHLQCSTNTGYTPSMKCPGCDKPAACWMKSPGFHAIPYSVVQLPRSALSPSGIGGWSRVACAGPTLLHS